MNEARNWMCTRCDFDRASGGRGRTLGGWARGCRALALKAVSFARPVLQTALLIGCVAGCGANTAREPADRKHEPARQSTVATSAPTPHSAESEAPSATQSGPAVVVTPVDRGGYDATLATLRGKVVLVDFWATWCGPCVEQLPHTLEMATHLRDRGLALVTVSCDDPAEATAVEQFLTAKRAAHATNLISQFGGSPQTMEAFEISSGAVPFYKLYDRSGKLRQEFGISPAATQQFTSGDVAAAVEKLLAE